MRKLLVAAAFLAAASPALAQPAYEDDWDDEAPAVRFDAREVDRMAGSLDRLVGAIMDLPVGGIAAAVDPLGRGGIYPSDTVRDIATRDDPRAEARIRGNIRATTRGVQAMSRSIERMMPVLRHSFEQISNDLRVAIDQAEAGADY